MRTFALEEHFVTKSFLRATGASGSNAPPQLADLQPKLLDLGAGRIADMDEAGIDFQVLSLAAMGFDALDAATASPVARDVNDELADAVRASPTRLAGFAALALKDPSAAAIELDRCITRLGFHGALLNGTTGGLLLDHPRFLTILRLPLTLRFPFTFTLHRRPSPSARLTSPAFPASSATSCRSRAGAGTPRQVCTLCASLSVGSSIGSPRCSSSSDIWAKGCRTRLPGPVASSRTPRHSSANPSLPTSRPTSTSAPADISRSHLSAVLLKSSALIDFFSPSITPSVPTLADGLLWIAFRSSWARKT
jgi:hypothetical protein